jgi:hypothetical protein
MERPERLERGVPSWLLKPEAKRDLWSPYESSWLVQWSCRAGTREFCPALAARVDPVQAIFFLTVHYIFHFTCPHCPISWVVSRAMCLW